MTSLLFPEYIYRIGVMAAHQTLTLAVVVQILHPVPSMLPWTNWSSRHPFKVESTGSSPVGSTIYLMI